MKILASISIVCLLIQSSFALANTVTISIGQTASLNGGDVAVVNGANGKNSVVTCGSSKPKQWICSVDFWGQQFNYQGATEFQARQHLYQFCIQGHGNGEDFCTEKAYKQAVCEQK